MSASSEYRRRAQQCDAHAARAMNLETKRAFLEAARQWRELAAQVERMLEQPIPPSPSE
jgi:hypothetical protein